MNEVNTAIYARLSADATLTALLYSASSIYHLQVPTDQADDFAYVVFNKQSDTEANDTSHRIVEMIYQVRAFTNVSAKAAQAMDARINTLLHGVTLTISNAVSLKLNRIGGIEDAFTEPNTDTVYSAGGLYRLRIERTS